MRWIALVLTAGELGLAIVSTFHGDAWALYLTITYWIRETRGGEHYHEIVVNALHIVILDWRRRFARPQLPVACSEPVRSQRRANEDTTTLATPS